MELLVQDGRIKDNRIIWLIKVVIRFIKVTRLLVIKGYSGN